MLLGLVLYFGAMNIWKDVRLEQYRQQALQETAFLESARDNLRNISDDLRRRRQQAADDARRAAIKAGQPYVLRFEAP